MSAGAAGPGTEDRAWLRRRLAWNALIALAALAITLSIGAISATIVGLRSVFGFAGLGLGAVLMFFFANPISGAALPPEAASLWVVEFLVTMQESVTASLGRLKTGEHHPLDAGVEEFHRVLAEVATIR